MKCTYCENDAVCIIKDCDGQPLNDPACSDCCGHGDEDGKCEIIQNCENCDTLLETELEQKRKKHFTGGVRPMRLDDAGDGKPTAEILQDYLMKYFLIDIIIEKIALNPKNYRDVTNYLGNSAYISFGQLGKLAICGPGGMCEIVAKKEVPEECWDIVSERNVYNE